MFCWCRVEDILVESTLVSYWPSTEPSIKRCTCLNKRNQVGVKQKYNQDTDGLSQLEIGCQRSENQLQTEGLSPQWPSVEQPRPRWGRSAAMVRRTLGQYVAVCPRLQLTSHTQPTSTLSRVKCERYILIKKCVRSFIEVCHYVWLCSAYICICIMYCVVVCGYTALLPRINISISLSLIYKHWKQRKERHYKLICTYSELLTFHLHIAHE